MYSFNKLLKQNVPWKRVVLGCWQLALSFFGPLVNRTISSSHFSLTSRGTMSGWICQKRGPKRGCHFLANSNSLDFNIIFQSLTIGKLRVQALENKCHWWPPDLLFSEQGLKVKSPSKKLVFFNNKSIFHHFPPRFLGHGIFLTFLLLGVVLGELMLWLIMFEFLVSPFSPSEFHIR